MATIKQAEYYIDNGIDFDEYRFKTDASIVNVLDTAKNYTSKNVEGILNELGTLLGNKSFATTSKNVTGAINEINAKVDNVEVNINNVIQNKILDAFYLDTESTTTGTKVVNADALSGKVFETNVTTAVKKIAEFTIPKCWHLPYNVGLRIKVNNISSASNILTVKANGVTIGTLKANDFEVANTWCFKNFLYDNDKSAITITIETTTSNTGTVISIENCYLSPIGMAFTN